MNDRLLQGKTRHLSAIEKIRIKKKGKPRTPFGKKKQHNNNKKRTTGPISVVSEGLRSQKQGGALSSSDSQTRTKQTTHQCEPQSPSDGSILRWSPRGLADAPVGYLLRMQKDASFEGAHGSKLCVWMWTLGPGTAFVLDNYGAAMELGYDMGLLTETKCSRAWMLYSVG